MFNEAFYPLTPKTLEKLYRANLTAAEWRLWTYLVTFDPWGEEYKDLPDTLTIMEKARIKKSTFYAAIAKLQKFGLYEFQDKGFAGRNLQGIPKLRSSVQKNGTLSEISESSPKKRNSFRENGAVSKKTENRSPEPLPRKDSNSPQTIQTIQTFTDSLSEAERESFLEFCRREVANYPRPIVNLPDYLSAPDASGKPRYLEFWRNFGRTPAGKEAAERQLASALTEELYNRWDKEFRAADCDYWAFGEQFERESPEWHLLKKFYEEWDRRNVVPVLLH